MNKKVLDLTNADDLQEYCDKIEELKDNELVKNLCNLFDIDVDKIFDTLTDYAENVYEEAHKDDEPKTPELVRPSSKLTTEQGLQIHKLVEEYVDTMIKPYVTNMDTKVINDAYAGLYEFAAWILNKE